MPILGPGGPPANLPPSPPPPSTGTLHIVGHPFPENYEKNMFLAVTFKWSFKSQKILYQSISYIFWGFFEDYLQIFS